MSDPSTDPFVRQSVCPAAFFAFRLSFLLGCGGAAATPEALLAAVAEAMIPRRDAHLATISRTHSPSLSLSLILISGSSGAYFHKTIG